MGKETRVAKQANVNRQLEKAVERVRKRGVVVGGLNDVDGLFS
jgi:hypothetical protein